MCCLFSDLLRHVPTEAIPFAVSTRIFSFWNELNIRISSLALNGVAEVAKECVLTFCNFDFDVWLHITPKESAEFKRKIFWSITANFLSCGLFVHAVVLPAFMAVFAPGGYFQLSLQYFIQGLLYITVVFSLQIIAEAQAFHEWSRDVPSRTF